MVRIAHSIPTDCSDLLLNILCICYCHSRLPLLQDWQLQVSCGRVCNVLVNCLLYKHAPSFLLARFVKKMLFPIPFRIDPTRKAIAVNSLLSQLQLSPLNSKTCCVRNLPRIYQGTNEYYVILLQYNTLITLYLLAYTALFRTFVSM